MDNPGDLHSKEPTGEMPLILLLYREGNTLFQQANKQNEEIFQNNQAFSLGKQPLQAPLWWLCRRNVWCQSVDSHLFWRLV